MSTLSLDIARDSVPRRVQQLPINKCQKLASTLIANHFIAKDGSRDYQKVVTYLRNPVILSLEILLLVCVITHALLGVRVIFLDFGLSGINAQKPVHTVQWMVSGSIAKRVKFGQLKSRSVHESPGSQ